MHFAVRVDAEDNITAQYAGSQPLPAPWLSVAEADFLMIMPGSTWSSGQVLPPVTLDVSPRERCAKQARAMIFGGLRVTSKANPHALNGTYPTDAMAQAKLLGIVSYINANGKFPGSSGTLKWDDIDGQPHVFSSVATFMALYTAGWDFVSDCVAVAEMGAGNLPDGSATIP